MLFQLNTLRSIECSTCLQTQAVTQVRTTRRRAGQQQPGSLNKKQVGVFTDFRTIAENRLHDKPVFETFDFV